VRWLIVLALAACDGKQAVTRSMCATKLVKCPPIDCPAPPIDCVNKQCSVTP
jgi:hypothetical protein